MANEEEEISTPSGEINKNEIEPTAVELFLEAALESNLEEELSANEPGDHTICTIHELSMGIKTVIKENGEEVKVKVEKAEIHVPEDMNTGTETIHEKVDTPTENILDEHLEIEIEKIEQNDTVDTILDKSFETKTEKIEENHTADVKITNSVDMTTESIPIIEPVKKTDIIEETVVKKTNPVEKTQVTEETKIPEKPENSQAVEPAQIDDKTVTTIENKKDVKTPEVPIIEVKPIVILKKVSEDSDTKVESENKSTEDLLTPNDNNDLRQGYKMS